MSNKKLERGLGLSSIEEAIKAYEKKQETPSVRERELSKQEEELNKKIKELKEQIAKQQEKLEALSAFKDITPDVLSEIVTTNREIYTVENKKQLEEKIQSFKSIVQESEMLSQLYNQILETGDPKKIDEILKKKGLNITHKELKSEIAAAEQRKQKYTSYSNILEKLKTKFSSEKELEEYLVKNKELWSEVESHEDLINKVKKQYPSIILDLTGDVTQSEEKEKKVRQSLLSERARREQLANQRLESHVKDALSPSYLQRDITRRSRERGLIGKTLELLEDQGYFQLQELFKREASELSATEQYIIEFSQAKHGETPEEKKKRLEALRASASLRQERVDYLGTIQGAIKQSKRLGLDPESIVEESERVLEQAKKRQLKEGFIERAKTGELGSEKEAKEKLLQAELELVKVHEEYKKALSSIGTEAEKTAEELDELGNKVKKAYENVEERKQELSAVQQYAPDKGLPAFLNYLAPIASLIRNSAQVYQFAAVGSEIGQSYGQAGLASSTVNARFLDLINSGRDAGAMLRSLGAYKDIFESASKAYTTTGITRGLIAGANALEATGSAITQGLTGNIAGGITTGINTAGSLAQEGISLYKGIPQSQQASDIASARRARFEAFTMMDAYTLEETKNWGINVAYSTRGFGGITPEDRAGFARRGVGVLSNIINKGLEEKGYIASVSDIQNLRKGEFDSDIKKGIETLFGGKDLLRSLNVQGFSGALSPNLVRSSLQIRASEDERLKTFLAKIGVDPSSPSFQEDLERKIASDEVIRSRAEELKLTKVLEFSPAQRQKQAQALLSTIESKYESPEAKIRLSEQLSKSGITSTVDEFLNTLKEGLKKVAENGEYLFSTVEKKAVETVTKIEQQTQPTAVKKGGRGREAFVRALTDEGWLRETIATSGLSKEEILSAARTGRDVLGGEFIKEGPETIREAGRLAAHGYFTSAEQYLSIRGMMSETMGDSKQRLEEIMSAAVAKGMDSSKNISALAQSSASLASAYASRGLDVGRGANQMILGGWQAALNAGMSPNMAISATMQSARLLNAVSGDTSLNLTGMMEATELMRAGVADPRTISVLQKMDLTELSSLSDEKLRSLGLDPSKREFYKSLKQTKSGMSALGGFMDNKMADIIEKLKSGKELTREEQITFNQGAYQANVSPEIFKAQLLGKGFARGAIDKSEIVREPVSATEGVEALKTAVSAQDAALLTQQKEGTLQGNIDAVITGLQTITSQMSTLLPLLQKNLQNISAGKGGELSEANIALFNTGAVNLNQASSNLNSAATKLSTYKP